MYTRTGDAGATSLFNGERRSKTDFIFTALGDVDELNAALGVVGEALRAQGGVGIEEQVIEIQSRLIDVGSAIATPASSSSETRISFVEFSSESAAQLETWIDEMDDALPPLKNFILPVCAPH